MRRPRPDCLIQTEALLERSPRTVVLAASGRRRRHGRGRRRWLLHAPTLGTPPLGWEQARVRVELADAQSSAASGYRLWPLSVEFDPGSSAFSLEVEERGCEIELEGRSFLVSFDYGETLAAESAPLVDSELGLPNDALVGLDYLVRDYNELRSFLLNRISVFAGDWRDRNAADLGVMLTEVLAYLGDDLSYYQDAVATEAYLETARRRTSVGRHTRLLSYSLSEGVGARVWVRFDADRRLSIPAGTGVAADGQGPGLVERGTVEYQAMLRRQPVIYETLETLELEPMLDTIRIVKRGNRQDYSIPAGATSVEVLDVKLGASACASKGAGGSEQSKQQQAQLVADAPQRWLSELETGYVLMFETRADLNLPPHLVRVTGAQRVSSRADASTVMLSWDPRDAPRTPIPVCAMVNGVLEPQLSVLRGNIALADFGERQLWSLPPMEDEHQPYRPRLPVPVVSHPHMEEQGGAPAAVLAEALACAVVPGIRLFERRDLEVLAGGVASQTQARQLAIAQSDTLEHEARVWEPEGDLLGCGPFARKFVVEPERGGVTLRFGDGEFGLRPPLGSSFIARARVGDLSRADVGERSLRKIITPHTRGKVSWFDQWALARLRVDNPVPSFGGELREGLVAGRRSARARARQIEAAMTMEDYERIACDNPQVADASAIERWTGSWSTVFVYVRGVEGSIDDAVLRDVHRVLARDRVAGREVVVRRPKWVPLTIDLRFEPAPGYGVEGVSEALYAAFFREPSGRLGPGFFHPSRWGFGQTVWASSIATWARGVRGVAHVWLERLVRTWDQPLASMPGAAPAELDGAPRLQVQLEPDEMPLVGWDPREPERGLLRIEANELRLGPEEWPR